MWESTDPSDNENNFVSQFFNFNLDFDIMNESDSIFHGTSLKEKKKPKEHKVSRFRDPDFRP